jgi:hypothetical protein
MMQKIFKYQKPISLIVLVSLFWLCMPQLPARGSMVSTEDVINQESTADFDRVRIRSFVSRNDVIIQLQLYGISSEEALAQVDSLTDQEIALIAGKLDQLPIGGDAYSTISTIACVFETAQYVYYGAIIILIVMIIILYVVKDEPS